MTDPDIFEWQLADILADEQAMFVLWTVKSLFCTRREDFLREYEFTENELDDLLYRLKVLGFLQEDGAELVLTDQGEIALSFLRSKDATIDTEQNARVAAGIQERFNVPKEHIYVEQRLIEQLKFLGWIYLEKTGTETSQLEFEGREKYSDVLLKKRLKKAIRQLNTSKDKPVPTEQQINEAIRDLERIQGAGLLEANEQARNLLLNGTYVSGTVNYLEGTPRHLNFINLEQPYSNDNEFLVLTQFHVALPGQNTFIVPDLVLFVNGIPLVVIECKNPAVTEPVEAGVTQLKRYASPNTGRPALFYFNVFLVVTCFYTAKLGTIEADSQEYQQWKDPYPQNRQELAQDLNVENPEHLSSQQLLVSGTLCKENLLDLLQNFVIFRTDGGRRVKIIARYQQFRAVQKAIHLLRHGDHKTADHDDQRGGIIWHTQGSGKSLTMVFLIRKMRKLQGLSRFKIVIITDRQDLQDQLERTMGLTGESIEVADNIIRARGLLERPSDKIIFVMIQKMREDEQEDDALTVEQPDKSPNILLIVDEAHRSHTSKLHLNTMNALPNSAKIGFTGTPIMVGTKRLTTRIFGDFIDTYTILESEQDGATIPILYEGYQAYSMVVQGQKLDQAYLYLTQAMPDEVRLRIINHYANETQVLEAQELIEAKARHMLLHYAANILPNHFKAMIVASSRAATVRYQAAIVKAREQLLETLEQLPPSRLEMSQEERANLPLGEQMLLQAYSQRELLRQLDCAAVISSEPDDDPAWQQWNATHNRNNYIRRFKLPLVQNEEESRNQDYLALLCVQQMLLTGFDAPVIQGLYLDRRLIGHNLLQAVARVNRTYLDKTYGIVVDYLGVARQLKEALIVYSAEQTRGALRNIKDEVLKLEARALRIKAIFSEQNIDVSTINLKHDRETIDICLNLFKDARFRADFEEKLKKFLESMDAVLPRPEAQQYIKLAEVLGYINKSAANIFPEEQINIKGTGKKIRKLIDEHITVLGIEQTVAPISITDTDFEDRIDQHISDETKASQMEHLARYYIREHYEENPVYYDRLSKRLEAILEELKGQWTEQVQQLLPFIWELRKGRQTDFTGLDPNTQLPFLDILDVEVNKGSEHFAIAIGENEEAKEQLSRDQRKELAEFTIKVIEMIRERASRRRDFWRRHNERRNLLARIIDFLDENDLITPEGRQKEVADQLLELAERLDELGLMR
ncbi:type I restriction endonuclease subunit R [Dictyobacter arantiisoli]|uniref:Type I restriction enzyme endonuclease subunit n=1 Tax=Dictyobacter arantiisoli TaxID=2014874 RepID=A0A5A5TH30_9CHLR|nr:HsdR family type I site-specific deoxyribonuclease [Dictyobacter arantiisoli]GCF10545.1 type I restriction enzyme [Dictyobacter arantiisoli]